MATNKNSAKKRSVASSSKTAKPAPVKNKLNAAKAIKSNLTKKKASVKTKSAPKVSYKAEYIKLLQKTNRTLTKEIKLQGKEIKSIRKAIEQPDFKVNREPEEEFEAFPKEPSIIPIQPPSDSIEQQILDELRDLQLQVRSRNIAFDDLVYGSAKLNN